MRESIGGTWIFSIVILFIALFSSFLAYSISYTRAFNMKSEILNIIERNEGFTKAKDEDVTNMTTQQLEENGSTQALILLKIKAMGYNYSVASQINCATVGHKEDAMQTEGGYCLTKFCPNGSENNKTYYKVTTFIAIKIPVINVTIKVPVTGETRTLYFDSSDLQCS